MKTIKLTLEATLVLLELRARGEESLNYLVESYQFDKKLLLHLAKSLKNRGLIYMGHNEQQDIIFGLSRKGQKVFSKQFAM